MRAALSTLLIAALATLPPSLAEDIRARTADGRDVVLKDDGTWSFVDAPGAGPDKDAETAYEGKRKTFALRLKPGAWIQEEKPDNPDAEVMFEHKDGDVYGAVIFERTAIPVNALKKIALANMTEGDGHPKILREETRKVDGVDTIRLTVEVDVDEVPLTFHNAYYSGPAGSIQVLTWTGRNLFDEMKPEMEKFLDGLVVLKK